MGRVFSRQATLRLVAVLSVAVGGLMASGALQSGETALEMVAESQDRMMQPHDLALSNDSRHLFVVDMGASVIRILDAKTLTPLARFGEGDLQAPYDVAVAPDGRVLVADPASDRLVVYRVEGRQAIRTDIWTGLLAPQAVAAADDGTVYAVTGDGAVVALVDGEIRHRAEGFLRPTDVVVDRQGRVLVTESGTDAIAVLTPDLQRQGLFREQQKGFNEPKALTLDGVGHVVVADRLNQQIKLLDRNFELLATFGDGYMGLGERRLNMPEGVAAHGPDIWVSDSYNQRILRFRRLSR